MKWTTILFSLLLLGCSSAPPINTLAENNDAIETQVAATVSQHLSSAVADLERAVNINSGTMNFAGVREVGSLFQTRFDEIGFTTHWVDGTDFGRAGHLVASHLSSQVNSPNILLIGHLDTVFAKDDSFQLFQEIDHRYVTGPGITDMKGGNIIMLLALRSLKELNLLDQLNIKVVLTGDEERSGKPLSASKAALIEAAEWADIALGFEDGDSNIKTAVVARRGSVSWQLNVTGRSAHSSQIFQPDVGYGAVFEAARILNTFREQLAGLGDLTFNPGLFIGGTTVKHDAQTASGAAFGKDNVISKTATVTGGIRASSKQELNQAITTMQKIVADNLAHTTATLNFDEGYPPLADSLGNRHLLSMYSAVSESLGYGKVRAVNPRNAGAADISFTAGSVDMALDGLGLMGRGGHTKDEVADMNSLEKNAQKAAVLLYRLSRTF